MTDFLLVAGLLALAVLYVVEGRETDRTIDHHRRLHRLEELRGGDVHPPKQP